MIFMFCKCILIGPEGNNVEDGQQQQPHTGRSK